MNLQEGYTSNFLRLRHLKMNLSTKTTKVEKKIRKTKKKKAKIAYHSRLLHNHKIDSKRTCKYERNKKTKSN